MIQTLLEDNKPLSRHSATHLDALSKNPTSNKQTKENPISSTTATSSNVLTSKEKNNSKFEECDEDGRLCLQSCVAFIPDEEIAENRLSVECIREIPRFSEYTPGDPSKVRLISIFIE